MLPVRLALNYKGLPYTTEWVEYPDLAPKFKALGIPPNGPEALAAYSSPTIRISDGSYIMESRAIVAALEKLQPEPSLHLDNGYTDRVQAAVLNTTKALAPIGIPRTSEKLLNPASQPYFNETRKKRFGMSLKDLAISDRAGETAWKNVEPLLDELKGMLHENEGGPYVMGQQVSYADFILAGLWRFVELLDEDGDLFGRGMKFDEAFPKHYEACRKWLERDSY
ncbi:hypothetical protein LTR08_004100 [Meristemomyces frigidus]|nr:hypothetical protein LTR08_004100 [Meristemomyces frigidus]